MPSFSFIFSKRKNKTKTYLNSHEGTTLSSHSLTGSLPLSNKTLKRRHFRRKFLTKSYR